MPETWTLTEEEIEEFDLPESAIDVEVIEEFSHSREVRGVFPDAAGLLAFFFFTEMLKHLWEALDD